MGDKIVKPTLSHWIARNLIVVVALLTVSAQTYADVGGNITQGDESVQPQPCAPREQGLVFLRYRKDNKCYQANTKGPCNENMILFPHPTEKSLGVCDCFDARGETEVETAYLNSRNLSHCIKEIRGQIYVPQRDRCFSVFDQGPCPDGKWLVLNGTFYPVCAKNTCVQPGNNSPRDPLATKFFFAASSKGECYQTETRGYCQKSYELRFSANHFIPKCRYIPTEKGDCPQDSISNRTIRKLRCKPGSRYDHLTKCSKSLNPR